MLGRNISTTPRKKSVSNFETQHALKVLSFMDKMRAWERICDFTVKVCKESFSVHRVVLAASSKYFEEILLGNTEEAKCGILRIHNFEPNIVKQCIEFIYTGEIDITLENVDHLLSASDFFKLTDLSKLCLDHLQKNLTTRNCLTIRKLCETHKCKEIEKSVNSYIQKNFDEIILTDEFSQLRKEVLRDYLMTVETDAEVLWEAVLRWVKSQVWTRKQHFFELLDINMMKLKTKFLLSTVWEEPLVQHCEQCRNLIVRHLFSNLEHLKESIGIGNCFLVRDICRSYPYFNCTDVQNAVSLYFMRNFEKIVRKESFKNFSEEEIFLIFSSAKTKCANESVKYEAAISWVEHDFRARRKYFTGLFKLIRLEKLSSEFLENVVRPNELVQNSQECKELITDTYFTLASPQAKKVNLAKSPKGKTKSKSLSKSAAEKTSNVFVISDNSDSDTSSECPASAKKTQSKNGTCRQQLITQFSSLNGPQKTPAAKTKPKSVSSKKRRISSDDSSSNDSDFISSTSSPDKKRKQGASPGERSKAVSKSKKTSSSKLIAVLNRKNEEIPVLDIGSTKWNKLVKTKSSVADFCTITSIEQRLYLLSGKSFFLLTKEKKWKKLASLPKQPSTAAKTVVFQKRLIVIDNCEVLRYSVILDDWDRNLPNLPVAGSFCTAATDQNIYVIGGNVMSSFANKYDPDRDAWLHIPSMETYRTDSAAAALDGRVYVLGGADHTPTKTVSCFSPIHNLWTEISSMNYSRVKLSVCTDGDRIYAVGGQQMNSTQLDSVEVYEKYRGEYRWKVVHQMIKYPLPIHCCLVSY